MSTEIRKPYDVASAASDFIVTDGRPLLRSLPLPDSNAQSITNVSADGRWFAGMDSKMFRWSRATGFTKLGVLPAFTGPFDACSTTGISDDGAVVVGSCTGEHVAERLLPKRPFSDDSFARADGGTESAAAVH